MREVGFERAVMVGARRERWHPRLLASGSQMTLRWKQSNRAGRFECLHDLGHNR